MGPHFSVPTVVNAVQILGAQNLSVAFSFPDFALKNCETARHVPKVSFGQKRLWRLCCEGSGLMDPRPRILYLFIEWNVTIIYLRYAQSFVSTEQRARGPGPAAAFKSE